MTHTQLLQTIAQRVLNNPHQASHIDKCGEFMKGHPPTFSHTSEPLEANDWLRAVERQLDIAQCEAQHKTSESLTNIDVPTMRDRSLGRSLARV